MKIRLGVIFGGESVEHEVSIISAVQAMNKLDREKYDIVPIYITKDRKFYTGKMLQDIEIYQDSNLIKRYAKEVALYERDGKFILGTKGLIRKEVAELDIVFPIVHGTNVEDGVLQGYLTTIGIPFVESDTSACCVGQDKVFMKNIFEANKLPITKYIWFYDTEFEESKEEILSKITKKLKFPVIVKPATLGSSIGIKKADNNEELISAIEDAMSYDKKIVVEEIVENLREVNISVLGNYENQKVSVIEEVTKNDGVLTFNDKYIGSGKVKGKLGIKYRSTKSKGMASLDRVIPAKIEENLSEEITKIAKEAFKVLGSSGVVRIDFLIDSKENKVYINEINSIPGSLSFYLWDKTGMDYTSLLDEVINIGIKDYKKRIKKVHSFDSNILKGFTTGIKGMKGKLK